MLISARLRHASIYTQTFLFQLAHDSGCTIASQSDSVTSSTQRSDSPATALITKIAYPMLDSHFEIRYDTAIHNQGDFHNPGRTDSNEFPYAKTPILTQEATHDEI